MNARLACAALAALLAAPAAAQSLVTGRVEYIDKAWDFNGWTGADPARPVRRADVHVLDASTDAILASGSTAQDGSFALDANLASVTAIKVRADCDTNLDGSFQRIRVLSEAGNLEYTVISPVIPVPVALPALDVGTLTALALVSGNDEGNPFNTLDLGVMAAEYLASSDVGAAPASQTIRIFWPGGSGSFASGNDVHLAEDDGYDDAVGLHELGHVVQNIYSDSDNPGGSHTFGDSNQDPQLSFGEGYATAFAGAVMNWMGLEALYVDGNGASQTGGSQLHARLETAGPFAQDAWGEADELSVACTLYDLVDTELSVDATPGVDDDLMVSSTVVDGVAPSVAWWEAFTGPMDAAPHVCIDDAWDGWLAAHAADPQLELLKDVFDHRRLRCWSDAQEPDNSLASAALLPAVKTGWTADRWLYYSSANPPAPGTSDIDWYAVPLVKGDVVTISTRYPAGAVDADTECDTLIDLFTPSGTMAATVDGGGTGRNASVTGFAVQVSGTWHYSVRSADTSRRYGRYEVRTLYVSQNHPPVIADGPHATPDSIAANDTTLLDVTATDEDPGQTLSYAWTPLDGGSILGSGAAVSFAPPAVTVPTQVRVRLVVSDSLGAESLPAEVQVQVLPAAGPCPGAPGAVTGGVAKPGQLGPPALIALNQPLLPSTNFALKGSGCLPSHACTLIFGFTLLSAPFDQGHIYPSPDLLLPLATNAQGEVLLPLVLGADPLMCGLTIHVQLMVPGDPGATGGKHTAQSNYVSLTFGS